MCRLLIASNHLKEQEQIKQFIDNTFMNIKILPPAISEKDALSIANRLLPEILIIDIDCLDVDGFDLKKKLVQLSPNLKIIILSSRTDFESVHHALRCGAIDYLTKPINFEELKYALDRCIKSLNQVSLMNVIHNNPTTLAKGQVNQMLDYIHDHYNEEISLTTLSSVMHLNRHYVSRFFKETVGMNFIDYLTNYRIEKAKQLLMTTNDSITEISGTIGYLDATYFSKLFKKKTKLSPHQFRKYYQGEHTPADRRFVLN